MFRPNCYKSFRFELDGRIKGIAVRLTPVTLQDMRSQLIEKFGSKRVSGIEPIKSSGSHLSEME